MFQVIFRLLIKYIKFYSFLNVETKIVVKQTSKTTFLTETTIRMIFDLYVTSFVHIYYIYVKTRFFSCVTELHRTDPKLRPAFSPRHRSVQHSTGTNLSN